MTYECAGLAAPLEQLVAVAHYGSVTDAARQLGVPQPTVSRTLARLSRDLGVDLIVPSGRGIELTSEGAVLAEGGERALAELRAALDGIRADRDAESGRVGLGFLHSMGPTAVPTLLRGYRQAHPGVSITLVQDSADSVIDALVEGRIDLALASPIASRPTLRTRALARQPLVALVPLDHRLAGRRRIAVADLEGDRLITMRPGYGVRTLTDSLLRSAGIPARYVLESDETTTMAGLVSAGLGVAILPLGHGTDGTVELALRDRGAERVVSLAWSARRRLAPPAEALRRHLVEHGPAALRPPRRV